MKYPLISIIVLNWNGKKHLKKCLSACINQTYPKLEVILVDNASTDGSVKYVTNTYPSVIINKNDENLGFAEGNNVGIRHAKGEWLFILNNDTVLDKNCVIELYKASQDGKNIGMVSPVMYLEKGTVDTLGLQLLKYCYTEDIKKIDNKTKLLAPCGGAAFYSKKMLDDIKIKKNNHNFDYFDSDYFIYYEDFDLGIRSRLYGWKCVHAPKATLLHEHGATMNKYSSKQVYLGDRNRMWSILKNYPFLALLRFIHWIVIMNIVSLLKWIVKGKGYSIIKSKISILVGMGKTFKKRRVVMQNKKIGYKEFIGLIAMEK